MLLRELGELTGHLIEIGIVDAQNYSTIQQLSGNTWTVSQAGTQLNLALKKRPYEEIYLELLSGSSFTLLLLDGALMQFSYEGSGEEVVRHRLAYLPSPTLLPYQNDPELYLREFHFVDIVGHQVVPVPVRFDFDAREDVARDLVHPVSHLTLGQYQHCRVPVSRPASPREFAEFIVHSFYSTPEMPRLNLKPHVLGLRPTITANELKTLHFSIPGAK